MIQETVLRTFLRILSFRIVALAVTAFFVGFNIALTIQLILIVCHYILERSWLKVSWGQRVV